MLFNYGEGPVCSFRETKIRRMGADLHNGDGLL